MCSSGYEIHILADGYSMIDNEGYMKANCTCTLIKGTKNTIVDTMTPWDGPIIIEGLRNHGLKPDDIDFVVSTHGHADHLGNNNLFLKATHIVGFSIAFKDKFYLHPFDNGTEYEIDSNLVRVLPTPGHTLDSVSVEVKVGAETFFIVGDLFEKEEDLADPEIWKSAGSENPELQIKNRSKVLHEADYIVPGHGPMFKVTDEQRKSAKMFCADYISAYIYHAAINVYLHQKEKDEFIVTVLTKDPFFTGAISGLFASLTVYPFDFVRKGVTLSSNETLKNCQKFHRFSTVPYAAVYFGLFFKMRDPESMTSQMFWSLVSSFSGAIAEIPFDRSKELLLGSRKTMILTSFLYAPFGAFMLIMYDKALLKLKSRAES